MYNTNGDKMIRKIKFNETLPIRQSVLWPDKTRKELILKEDPTGSHFGFFLEEKLVAVISVFVTGDSGQFRKFACLQEHQGKGIGTALLKHTLSYLNEQKVKTVWCNARVAARKFYQGFGLVPEADTEFTRGHIKYEIMLKQLETAA